MGTIRLLLALAVVIAHLGKLPGWPINLTGGGISVQLFYIISGFYMALVLNEKYPPGSYWTFISNRFLRLFPTYLVALLLTLGYGFFVWKSSGRFPITEMNRWAQSGPSLDWISKIGLAFCNLFIIGQDWTFYFGFQKGTGDLLWTTDFRSLPASAYRFMILPQAWTLGVEFTFYLLAPLLVRRKTIWIVGMIVASVLLRLWFGIAFGLNDDPFTHRFFPFELALFMSGCLAYKLYKAAGQNALDTPEFRWLPLLLVLVMICAYSYVLKTAMLFALFTLALPFIFHATKRWKWDRLIGELSYPLYISHLLVLIAVRAAMKGMPVATVAIVCVIASLALAVLLVVLVEIPVENWRQERVRKAALKRAKEKPELLADNV